jgi:hypothetical protein
MTEADTTRAPALFGHCTRVYNAMLQEAKRVDEAGVTLIVWEGFPTKLIMGKLKLSTPYYTYTLQALQAMGCVRQLRRGGSSTKSQWELIMEPSVEAFLETNAKEPSPSEVRMDATEQMLRDVIRRLERLEHLAGVDKVAIDFISDPTPPGGIEVKTLEGQKFVIDHDPTEWVDEDDLDNTPGLGVVDN